MKLLAKTIRLAIVGPDVMTYRRGGRGEEDEGAEVGSALVGESSSSIDQSTDTI